MFSPRILEDEKITIKELTTGILLYKGEKVKKDLLESSEQFRLGWELGHPICGYNYAVVLHELGEDEKSKAMFEKVKKWFSESWFYTVDDENPLETLISGSKEGSKLCSLSLGYYYTVTNEWKKAEEEFEKALTSDIEGVKEKAMAGISMIRKNEKYILETGRSYLSGNKKLKGIGMLNECTLSNDKEIREKSNLILGSYYELKLDFFKAHEYYLRSGKPDESERVLEKAYRYARADKTDEPDFTIMEKLWNIHKMKKAALSLGRFYRYGVGCEMDIKKSYDYYKASDTVDGWIKIIEIHESGLKPYEVDLIKALRICEDHLQKLVENETDIFQYRVIKERIEQKISLEFSDYLSDDQESESYVEIKPDTHTSKVEFILRDSEDKPEYLYIAGLIYMAENDKEKAKEMFIKGGQKGNRDCLYKLGEMNI